METFRHILLATDFSETSAYATQLALMMARTFNARLDVLHVTEAEIAAVIEGTTYLPSDYYEEVEKRAAEKLEEVIPREDRDKMSVTLALRQGSPFVEIIQYARDQHIDLIVLGTHGRGAVSHLLLGNVAERVVRKSPCPVLTVRHPKHEFVMP